MNPPFYRPRVWLRTFVKALVLLLIFDVLFIALRPFDAIEPLSLFGHVLPYRSRLIMPAGDAGNQLMPLETMVKAHEISRPKASDEFRVLVLGDSGINGWSAIDSETISGYITASGQLAQGKHIRAYNLAFLGPSVTRDLVIADAALAYQPDMIVWFVTLQGFQNQNPDPLLALNQPRVTKLTSQFGLADINAVTNGHWIDTWWQHSILFRRKDIYRWLQYQSYALQPPALLKSDNTESTRPLPEQPILGNGEPAYMPMPNPVWASLPVLPKLTAIPVLIVNEPILIVPDTVPGTRANYDSFYGRAIYDTYRLTFAQYCHDQALHCLDLWDLVQAADYTDSPLHRSPAGNAAIAARVLIEFQNFLH